MNVDRARRASRRTRGASILTAVALALVLAGCATTAGVLQVTVDGHSPQYVRGQIINAMRAAGYQKVSFSSFDTHGIMVPEIRSASSDEYRFQRGDAAYVARVYFDKPRTITVRLDVVDRAGSADAGRADLVRIRNALRDVFGEITVIR